MKQRIDIEHHTQPVNNADMKWYMYVRDKVIQPNVDNILRQGNSKAMRHHSITRQTQQGARTKYYTILEYQWDRFIILNTGGVYNRFQDCCTFSVGIAATALTSNDTLKL